MDLKYGNIMMEPHNKQPIMIDFGISVDQKALSKASSLSPTTGGSVRTSSAKQKNVGVRGLPGDEQPSKDTVSTLTIATPRNAFYVYDTYTAWCFDIFLCNYIVQIVQPKVSSNPNALDDTPTKEELESMMKEFQYGPLRKYARQDKTRNDIFTTTLISKSVIEQFREKTIASFTATTNTPKSWNQLYDQCIQTLYKTWDNYGIAAMYLGIIDILKYSKRDAFEQIETVRTISGKPFLEEYIHIIESVVYADPFHRPSVKETMTHLHQLVKG
jgi:serine/threonine protein kinase